MSVGGPFYPERHPRLCGTDFACGGLEQANGAASPAMSSRRCQEEQEATTTMALNWDVQGGGSSIKEGCRIAGKAERYGIARSYGT